MFMYTVNQQAGSILQICVLRSVLSGCVFIFSFDLCIHNRVVHVRVMQ